MAESLEFSIKDEEYVRIPLSDGRHAAYGMLRGGWSKPLIVLVHGMNGSGSSILQWLGAKYFAEKSYATLRINLYGDERDARDIVDCNLQVQADDFDTIIKFIRSQKPPKIFAEGHSYGGLTILKSSAQLDAAALWDPSHVGLNIITREDKEIDYKEIVSVELKLRIGKKGKGYIQPLLFEQEQTQLRDTTNLAAKNYPLLFVAAGNGSLVPYVERYFKTSNKPKKLVSIEGATHNFIDTDSVTYKLFDATLNWFNEYKEAG